MVAGLNVLGAVVAVLFFLSAIGVFTCRLTNLRRAERWLGYFEYLLAVPLVYLLIQAPAVPRPWLYYVQIGFALLWLAGEWVLDDLLKIGFRHTRRLVISYVVLFFAAAGGLMGIASLAGRGWTIAAGSLFLVMAVLTFVQRKVTGE